MDIKEHCRHLEECIAENDHYLQEAVKKKNFGAVAINVYDQFINLLELGLIQWRLGRSPVSTLQKALDSLLTGRKSLLEAGVPLDSVQEMPVVHSIYIAALLDVPHPVLNPNDYPSAMAPAAFLGNVLIGGASIKNWDVHRERIPNQKRNALARATFDLYADLLSGAMVPEEGVRRGEAYYLRRKNDASFNNAPMLLGGTEHNDRFVDFRLAAVLKKIGSTVPTVHAWRW